MIVFPILFLSGCLRNLNVSEFFRKLEAKNSDYYELVVDHQSEIEEAIIKNIEEEGGKEVDWITFWGEGRYACGDVIVHKDGYECVQVLGKCQLEGDDFSRVYTFWFIPDESEIVKKVDLYYPYSY